MTATPPNNLHRSPIATSLEQAITACLGDSTEAAGRQIRVFSYARDFSILWELEANQTLQAFSDRDFLIVVEDEWNQSSDLPEANKHLTALDWAVWFTLSRAEPQGGAAYGLPTLILLRKNDKPTTSSLSDAQRFWSMFADRTIPALPRIKLVSLIGRDGEPCCLVQILRLIVAGSNPQPLGDLSLIRQVWQSFFLRPTRPSDNHALANLLGTGLLTGNFGSSPTRHALLKLLQTLTLLPSSEKSWKSPIHPNAIVKAANALRVRLPHKIRSKLRLLLVDDDQERHDWAEFVAAALGLHAPTVSEGIRSGTIGDMEAEMLAIDQANELLDRIRESRSDPGGLRFEPDHAVDILFLDLRLFERSSLQAEAAFFLDIIKELRSTNCAHSASPGDWPRVAEDELRKLAEWCEHAIADSKEASRNDDRYIASMTLLPRLAAIIDPDLPIVLFSSSHRRKVIELLKPYGNIITTFSKPALQLGNSEQLVEETFVNFERAVLAAFDLLYARRLRRLLLNEEFPVYWKGHSEKPVEEKADHPWSVQLLLDESGRVDAGLRVGGFLAVYPPDVNPHIVNNEIHQRFPEIREWTKEERREHLPEILWKVIGILEQSRVLVVPISLSGSRHESATAHSEWKGSSSFQDEVMEDNLHRQLMRCLIELGLYVFARQILPESASVEFHFHAPTRQLPASPEEAETLDNVWGIHSYNGNARHFDHGSARSLVDEICREYHRSVFEPQPVLARAYGLNTTWRSEVEKVRALHYLADCWINNSRHPDLASLRDITFNGRYSPGLARLLEAHRHLVHGRVARAIAIGAPVAVNLPTTERSTAVNSIVIALQDAAKSMTGPERLAMAAILRKRSPDGTSSPAVGAVHSIDPTDGSLMIAWGGKLFAAARKEVKDPVRIGDRVQFLPRRGNRLGMFVAKRVRKCVAKT